MSVLRSVRKVIGELFVPASPIKGVEISDYLSRLESGEFKNRTIYGISEKGDFIVRDPVKNPGSLMVGGMGGGKSVGNSCATYCHYMANSSNTIYVLLDPEKGANEYKLIKGKENVIVGSEGPANLVPLVDLIDKELDARRIEFKKYGADNITVYEDLVRKKTGDKSFECARIFIVAEEFHAYPNDKKIEYDKNYDKPGTPAYKLRRICKVGRSYGVDLHVVTQRATFEDIPSQIAEACQTQLAFRIMKESTAASIGLERAVDIPSTIPGRALHKEEGFVQVPLWDHTTLSALIEKYGKPFKGAIFSSTLDKMRSCVETAGTSGMLYSQQFKTTLQTLEQFDIEDVSKRVLEFFKFDVEAVEDQASYSRLVAVRDGVRYAVLTIKDRDESSLNKKKLEYIYDRMPSLSASGIIVIDFYNNEPDDMSERAIEKVGCGACVAGDDLQIIAKLIDNEDDLRRKQEFEAHYYKQKIAQPLLPAEDATSEDDDSDDNDDDSDLIKRATRFSSTHKTRAS